MGPRLSTILRAVRDSREPVNLFLADCLIGYIRSGAVHLMTFDDAPEDSVDRLARMQQSKSVAQEQPR